MLEHILRRLGFGASPAELSAWAGLPIDAVIDRLLNYESLSTDHDSKIGNPDYLGITPQTGQPFSPNTLINDARQRWVFRMVHSQRPLEEKMALFWHNHFATAYSKIAGAIGPVRAARLMDNDPHSLAGTERGMIQKLRELGTGSFATLLWEMAKDPAMIYWLDSQLNTRTRPQENFGREIMELFSMGIGNYTEQDVYAAARVFTGFNWQLNGDRANTETSWYSYRFVPNDHDATAKTFTFAIYPDGSKTIPARPAGQGEQDALDFVLALVRNPATARRLATRLYKFFVNETATPDEALVAAMANAYLGSNYSIKSMLQTIVNSQQFRNPANFFQRYSWPAEYVVRAIKEVGWNGFSASNALTPMSNMGQQLFEPPDVNGWDLGAGWVSTSAMLARMNFASTLAGNQRFNLARDLQPYRQSPDGVLNYMLARFRTMGFDASQTQAMLDYLRSTAWTGSDAQLQQRIPGLTRLIVGAGEYVFN